MLLNDVGHDIHGLEELFLGDWAGILVVPFAHVPSPFRERAQCRDHLDRRLSLPEACVEAAMTPSRNLVLALLLRG
jgi:hypothetical protein